MSRRTPSSRCTPVPRLWPVHRLGPVHRLWRVVPLAVALAAPLHASANPPAPPDASAPVPEPISEPISEPAAAAQPADRADPADPADRVPAPAAAFDETPLVREGEAQAAFADCLERHVPQGSDDGAAARACLEDVRGAFAGTDAALRAEGALSALHAWGRAEAAGAAEGGFRIPPGRLELSSTAGLFGIWTGIASGIALSAHLQPDPALAVLGSGALSLGLGIGAGIGGYALAESMDLSEGDSRLVASGLVWGTTFGIAALPLLTRLNLQGSPAVSVPLLTVVSGGALGGGLAVLAASRNDFDTAEVSLINTGGWVGALLGLLSLPTLGAWQIAEPELYTVSYLTFASAGLAAGFAASRAFDLSWGETLMLDLGGVLGLVTGGTAMLTLTAAGWLSGLPGEVGVPLVTGSLALTTVGGVALAGAGLALFGDRTPRARTARAVALDPMTIGPSVVLDLERQPVLVLQGPALRF